MKRFTTYNQTLEFLFSQLPMYQRIGGKAMKKDLTNIIQLCDFLGNPQAAFKSVHIAGTNGKGSVSHFIAGGFQAQGLRVGLYTSPHYRDFRERIKVNGQLISKKEVVDFVNLILPVLDSIGPSFFEITVAMSFSIFKSREVDIAVIETGLGGRLDSTNIINPLLSVITNISFDHMGFLGNSLKEIAFEKAGIIKEKKPVIVGERQAEVEDVFLTMAKEKSSTILFAEDEIEINDDLSIIRRGIKLIDKLKLDVEGPFLQKNLTTALCALNKLRELGLSIDWDKVKSFYANISESLNYIGRWQWLSKNPPVLVDSAHNEAGMQYVLSKLETLSFEKIHFVLGFVKDKDIDKIIKYFPKAGKYYFAKADIPRGMDANILKEKFASHHLIGKSYVSVRKALSAAKLSCRNDEMIFVGGSIFTVAEVI